MYPVIVGQTKLAVDLGLQDNKNLTEILLVNITSFGTPLAHFV